MKYDEIAHNLSACVSGDLEKSYLVADAIESFTGNVQLIRLVFKLFEANPLYDFGSPGPLAHAIESSSGRGYEEELLLSLDRKPTAHTLVLARRLLNACDGFHMQVRERLRRAVLSGNIDENCKTCILEILEEGEHPPERA